MRSCDARMVFLCVLCVVLGCAVLWCCVRFVSLESCCRNPTESTIGEEETIFHHSLPHPRRTHTLLTRAKQNKATLIVMPSASSPPLHVLRGILRLMKKSAPSKSSTAPVATTAVQPGSTQPANAQVTLRQHIISQYRLCRSLPPSKVDIQQQIAYDFYILKKDLKERARLHELDQGADEKLSPKELSRRAAARAGLQLPVLDSEEDARRME